MFTILKSTVKTLANIISSYEWINVNNINKRIDHRIPPGLETTKTERQNYLLHEFLD